MSPTILDDVPATEPIFEDSDQNANFHFPTDLSFRDISGPALLKEKQILALAVTEFCCQIGRGKVYWLPLEDSPAFQRMPKSIHKTSCAYSYHRLPKLIYVPFVWGKKDRIHWHAMKHSDRLLLLNARSGGLKRKENVMPMDCTYDAIEKKTARLNAYNGEHTGCAAVVAIVPKAYVGWCVDLQKDAWRMDFAANTMEDGFGAYYVARNEVIEQYRAENTHDLVQRLWDMYFMQKPRSLIRFEDVLRGVMNFRKTWLIAGSERSA